MREVDLYESMQTYSGTEIMIKIEMTGMIWYISLREYKVIDL